MTVAETEEKDAQGDYEQMMKDSAEKRAEDSKSLSDKESCLADMTAALEKSVESKASTTKELGATLQYIQSLHNECDWLVQTKSVGSPREHRVRRRSRNLRSQRARRTRS